MPRPTYTPCQASPHCPNPVKLTDRDANGYAICPTCAADFDAYEDRGDLDADSSIRDRYVEAESTPANGRWEVDDTGIRREYTTTGRKTGRAQEWNGEFWQSVK